MCRCLVVTPSGRGTAPWPGPPFSDCPPTCHPVQSGPLAQELWPDRDPLTAAQSKLISRSLTSTNVDRCLAK